MDDYTIKPRMLESAMRRCIDSAVHEAVSHFRDRLGEHDGVAYKVARVAAENAVEQFRTYCNAQLRVIQAEHELRADMAMLKPLNQLIQND